MLGIIKIMKLEARKARNRELALRSNQREGHLKLAIERALPGTPEHL